MRVFLNVFSISNCCAPNVCLPQVLWCVKACDGDGPHVATPMTWWVLSCRYGHKTDSGSCSSKLVLVKKLQCWNRAISKLGDKQIHSGNWANSHWHVNSLQGPTTRRETGRLMCDPATPWGPSCRCLSRSGHSETEKPMGSLVPWSKLPIF